MNLQVKAYVCVITEDTNNIDFITANNYLDLILKTIESILESKCETCPEIIKFKVNNSIDFISEYGEEEYRDILNEMVFFLARKGQELTTKIFEVEQTIDEEHLVSISHDVL